MLLNLDSTYCIIEGKEILGCIKRLGGRAYKEMEKLVVAVEKLKEYLSVGLLGKTTEAVNGLNGPIYPNKLLFLLRHNTQVRPSPLDLLVMRSMELLLWLTIRVHSCAF